MCVCVSSCSLLTLDLLKCFCVSLSLVSVSVVVPAPARFMSCPVHNPCRVWKRSSPLSFWVRRASLGWLAPAVPLLLQQRPVKSQLSPRCLYHFCLSLHLACSGSVFMQLLTALYSLPPNVCTSLKQTKFMLRSGSRYWSSPRWCVKKHCVCVCVCTYRNNVLLFKCLGSVRCFFSYIL